MKHTDKFFLFPVKCQNDQSFFDAEYNNSDWVLGYARLPYDELFYITWSDMFSKDRLPSEVSDKGCDLTHIFSEKYGRFICLWTRKKFENKLNEYIDKVNKEINESGELSIVIGESE